MTKWEREKEDREDERAEMRRKALEDRPTIKTVVICSECTQYKIASQPCRCKQKAAR